MYLKRVNKVKRCASIIVSFLLLAGCSAGASLEGSISEAPPEETALSYAPIELQMLSSGVPSAEWKEVRSLLITSSHNIAVKLYKEASSNDLLPAPLHAVIEWQDNQYVIKDVSTALESLQEVNCPALCGFETSSAESKRYQLLASMELFAKGPGRNLFVLIDRATEQLVGFEEWGTAAFYDLEADGDKEMVIEFPGLHLNRPDIKIIRIKEDGMEASLSFLNC